MIRFPNFKLILLNSFIINIKMLRDIKITKCERNKKTERRKDKINHLTPEKLTSRESTYNTVSRLEKKYGYDYDNAEDC